MSKSSPWDEPRAGGGSHVDTGGEQWDMDSIYQHVRALPEEAIIQLARGPRQGWDCAVCHVLGQFAPLSRETPGQRLSHWHSELVVHERGHGRRQDPSRCGVIYGVAKALAEELARRPLWGRNV